MLRPFLLTMFFLSPILLLESCCRGHWNPCHFQSWMSVKTGKWLVVACCFLGVGVSTHPLTLLAGSCFLAGFTANPKQHFGKLCSGCAGAGGVLPGAPVIIHPLTHFLPPASSPCRYNDSTKNSSLLPQSFLTILMKMLCGYWMFVVALSQTHSKTNVMAAGIPPPVTTFLGVVTAQDLLFFVELLSHKHKENKGNPWKKTNAAKTAAVRETLLHAYNWNW
jgi:hypothetical protein